MLLSQFRQVGDLAIDLWESVARSVDGMDLANGTRPDPFADAADGVARMPLVAKLSHDLVAMRGGHQRPDLVDGVCEWLFAIHMPAAAHRLHGNDRVCVIWRANDHAVHARSHLVEEDAIVRETLRVGIFGELLGSV